MTTAPATSAASQATQPAAHGPVHADEPEYDFGQVWAGERISHTFRMTNTGSTFVLIRDVRSTCRCTMTERSIQPLDPGETRELPVTLDTTGLQGEVRKQIEIYTDDRAQPTVAFTLKGLVRERLSLAPSPSIVFGTLAADSAQKRTLTITSHLDQEVTLADPQIDSGLYRATLREVETGRRYELDVETVPPLKDLPPVVMVTIQTDVAEQPELKVPVVGHLQSPVQMTPQVLKVPQPLAQDLRRELVLRGSDGVRVRAREVEVSPPGIAAEIQPIRQDQEYQILVTIPKGLELPAQGGVVTVLTDNPDYPTFNVPLQGYRTGATSPVTTRPAPEPAAKPAASP